MPRLDTARRVPTGGGRAGRSHSVGTKLVLATCLSLAIIFGVVYLGLTSREKANLLNAKRMAGEMVLELFTESVSAAVVFEDQTGVADALKFLGKNHEVSYAALWRRDASDPSRLGERIAELRRPSDPLDYGVPRTREDRSVDVGQSALTIAQAVKDPSGTLVGHVLAVFSLAREQKLFAELSQRILIAAAGTATLIAILLAGLTRALVIRRLARLAAAAQQLERGEPASIDRGADDEVGQLADALSQMAESIAEREARIQTQNREMRFVLDNVAQGFITVTIDGTMSLERSAIVDRWFGEPTAGISYFSYLRPHAPRYADLFDLALEQLREGVLPLALAIDQMPQRFAAAGRTFDVSYTASAKHEKIERLLVIISDVSAQLARERAERDQRELVGLFQRILRDRTGVEEFLTEAAGMVDAARSERDPKVQLRLVHTLKGNCAWYGLETYADVAHHIESELSASRTGLRDEQRRLLVQMWKEMVARVNGLLGHVRRDSIELQREELAALIELARADVPAATLIPALKELEHESAERRLERLARQAGGIARRQNKPEPLTLIDGGGIRLASLPFWSELVHLVRNAVDHGIEDPVTRAANGKPEAGTLTFTARRIGERVNISIGDDGQGVDWEKVRAKAASAGLPSETREDLVEALFTDGISTRQEVSMLSGRGVGLAAVRQAITDIGGQIEVRSTAGRGTIFEIAFDERSAVSARENVGNGPSHSLLPAASVQRPSVRRLEEM